MDFRAFRAIQKGISNKLFHDVILSNFVTNIHNDLNSSNVLHRLMVKMKQVFNLKRGVDFREHSLRKNFNNWLHLVSEKIRAKTYFDGDLIIIIEGVNLFVEPGQDWEVDLKFWLPRELPPRVKIILTIEEGSHNIAYLKKIGCRFLHLRDQTESKMELLDCFAKRQFFCEKSFAESTIDILRERIHKEDVVSNGLSKSKSICNFSDDQ